MQTKDYEFEIGREKINRITCNDGTVPKAKEECKVDTNEFITCGPGESYVVELLDLAQKSIQGLAVAPSLG